MFECADNIKTAQFNMQYLSIIAIFVMQFAVFLKIIRVYQLYLAHPNVK